MRTIRTTSLGTLFTLLVACGGGSGSSGTGPADCEGAKCDTPGGKADENCEKRQAEVLGSSNRGYTPEGTIRWACADVEGVNTNNQDDRGQEYCEYFAIVQPPLQEGEPKAFDLGRPTGDGVTPLAVCLEGEEKGKDCGTTITQDQLDEIADNPAQTVGACMFTSWHSDTDEPLAVCEKGCPDEANVFGFPLTNEFFQMKVSFNSNRAAADLVERCFDLGDRVPEPDFKNPDAPANDPFFRGCIGVGELFGTEWRRSDPSICAAVNRLRECGCGATGVTNAKELGDAVVPPQPQDGKITLRGFRLGTWDDPQGLPQGCRYVDVGEDSKTLVQCDLTAADLLENLNDPKEACRARFGPNVVVHVDVPVAAVTCMPGDDEIGQTCGPMPWNLGAEGEPVGSGDGGNGSGGDECCKTCKTSQACGDSCISNDSTCSKEPGCACQG